MFSDNWTHQRLVSGISSRPQIGTQIIRAHYKGHGACLVRERCCKLNKLLEGVQIISLSPSSPPSLFDFFVCFWFEFICQHRHIAGPTIIEPNWTPPLGSTKDWKDANWYVLSRHHFKFPTIPTNMNRHCILPHTRYTCSPRSIRQYEQFIYNLQYSFLAFKFYYRAPFKILLSAHWLRI